MSTAASRRRAAGGAGMAALLALGAAACSTSTDLSSGSVAGCARSLPAAQHALNGAKGHLVGVHRIPAHKLPARIKTVLPATDDSEVCAIAFHGTFPAGKVTDAPSTASGDYAVVLVDARHLDVVGSFVGDHLPKGLKGHLL